MNRSRVALVVGGAAFAILAAHLYTYRGFFVDDAYISLRYARRLTEGHGLTFTDGETVEGYTNLLWVLACAGLGSLGIDLAIAAKLLGWLAAGAVIGCTLYIHRVPRLGLASPMAFAALVMAAAGPLAIWANGGLETALWTALFGWAVAACFEMQLGTAGILFALLALTRADGILLVGATSLGLYLGDRRQWRGIARMLAIPLAAVLVQLVVRRLYYDRWVPNTATAKLGLHVGDGVDYLAAGARSLGALLVPALLAIAVVRDRRRAILLAVPLVAWSAYVVAIGGDWMPGHRHLLVCVLLLALLGAELLRELATRGRRLQLYVGAIVAASAIAFAAIQVVDPDNTIARHEHLAADGERVGRALETKFAGCHPLLAVDAAGALPYFSELPTLDLLGLTDRYLAEHPPDAAGGGIGHQLGDGAYALARRPDVIVFCGPLGGPPCFRSGREMVADPRFARDYMPIDLDAGTVHSQIWLRRAATCLSQK